jgi:endonuclease YncB( thermonuclease family)
MRSLLSSLLVAAILATPAIAAEWVHEGRVVRIKDGDTFVMLDGENRQHEGRFAGSDSPERRQPFYQVSGDNLAKLVFGRHVETRCYKVDRWYRDVCRVYDGGSDIGLQQVRAGMACTQRPIRASRRRKSARSTREPRKRPGRTSGDCGPIPTPLRHGSGARANARRERGAASFPSH